MRLPDDKIKAAILHPEAGVRLAALQLFAESHSKDPSIMPLVITAVEEYAWKDASDLLHSARLLHQTSRTVDWLIAQLRRPFNIESMEQDNLRFTIALTLVLAEPELLAERHGDIVSAASFPEQLKGILDYTLKVRSADWPELWRQFEDLGHETMEADGATVADNRKFHLLTRAMAHHRNAGSKQVLSLLNGDYRGHDPSLMFWLEPKIVMLAGHMGLQKAVPVLMNRLKDALENELEAVSESVACALPRIGGDGVIRAIADKWKQFNGDGRLYLIEPLRAIRSDLALDTVLSLPRRTKDEELRSGLASAALGQCATESIEPVRRLLLASGEGGDYWELRYGLIAMTTLLGGTFPEYEEWHREAVATNYGFEKIKDRLAEYWISDSFREDDDDEKPSRKVRRIKAGPTLYQIKITLRDIKPPVWRRLLVPSCTLDDLHEIVQIAMGWESYHLYSFSIDGQEFTHPDMDEGELNMEDATAVTLDGLGLHEKQKLIYLYDFGDGWKHEIVVENIGKPEAGQKYPVCVKGSRACPPEDVGGPFGYTDYLKALADPAHERHQEFLNWRGEFNPEGFDAEAVNQNLRKVFP